MTHYHAPHPPLLDAPTFDAIAGALGDDVLLAYEPPARPFTLGTKESCGIRRDYRAQAPSGDGIPQDSPAVQQIARRIAAALGNAPVVSLASLLDGALRPDPSTSESIPLRDAVVICADTLQRTATPDALLDYLVQLLDEAAVAIVAVPLRALTFGPDNLGPPQSPGHAREWTFPELQAGLDAIGLEPLFGGVLPVQSSDSDPAGAPHGIGVVIVSTRTATARAARMQNVPR